MSQRKIRFRAWDERNKKMIYNVTVYPDHIGFSKKQLDDTYGKDWQPELGCEPECAGDVDWFYWLDGYKLMQYTGLKDKNGKEIYEGDIVRYVNKEYVQSLKFQEISEVFWDDAITGYYIEWGKKNEAIHYLLGKEFDRNNGIEVIGNIWEHPGLLGEKN